jgi:hypothetical protein
MVASCACRERPGSPDDRRGEGVAPSAVASGSAATPSALTRPLRASAAILPATTSDERPARSPADFITPPDHPSQRLAFSRSRLAWLDGDELIVRRLAGFGIATRFRTPEARSVVPLVGGGFLIAGRDHVFRLSGIEQRPELFARAPRLGPTAILPSNQEAEQFWLFYQGIPQLPQFDLAQAPVAGYLPVTSWLDLVDFDRRALLGFGDGSMVYTVADGLRRIDAEGRREHLPAPELAGRVWALARARRRDQVWAMTPHHAYLVTVRGAAETVARIELSPRTVAVAAQGSELAALSVESVDDEVLRLRIDVHSSSERLRVLRFNARPAPIGDAGQGAALEPEVAWSPSGDLLAVSAFGLHVFDWRRDVAVFPVVSGAQNLAPPPP